MRQYKSLTATVFAILGIFHVGFLLGAPTEAVVASGEPEAYFDIVKVFQSCPIIYSSLLLLSVISLSIWLYSMITLRISSMMPKEFVNKLNELLSTGKYEAALAMCKDKPNYTSSIIGAGIAARKHGSQVMIEAMNSEGKRSGLALWQRISLLNEVAVIAPMLGLLGTVVGLFFAFYDSTRNAETITSIFDGLGIAVGTTVVGLIVSILAMLFYTTLKFRVVNLLNTIENETLTLATQVEMTLPKNHNS
jgi:biopolymer transport protein ExbB